MVVGETVGSSLKPYLSIPCNDFRLMFVCSAWESGYQIVARVTPLLFHQTEHLPVNVPKHTPDITLCLQELSSGNGDVSRLSSRQQIVVNLSVCWKIIYDTCTYVWSRGTDSLQVLKREPCGFSFLNAIQFCSPNILCVVLRMLCKKKKMQYVNKMHLEQFTNLLFSISRPGQVAAAAS